MTTNTTAIDHADRRLVVALLCPYDDARAHYETLVPQVDSARFSQMCSWQATLELAEINATHGLRARLIILLGGDLPLQLAAINASGIGGA